MKHVAINWALACAAVAISTTMSLPAARAEDANKPGLTGEFRANAVSTGVAACRKLKDDRRAAWVPAELVDQACTCVANRLADQLSINDTTRLMITMMGAGAPTRADTLLMLDSVGTCLSEAAKAGR